MPNRNCTSNDAPGASGCARVTTPTLIDVFKPPPTGCAGGCSRVVPCTVVVTPCTNT